jgi:hypothetical protein
MIVSLKKMALSILFFLMVLVSQFTVAQINNKSKKIRINPSETKGGLVTQYTSKVKFIPLQANKLGTFGSIDQLEVTDKYFIILDKESNAIFVFNKDGKFYSKIEGKQLGSQNTIYNFYLDIKGNLIEIPFGRFNFYFDYNGKMINKVPVKDWFGFKITIGNTTAYYDYFVSKRYLKDSIAHELMLFENNTIKKKYFPYNIKYENMESRDVLSANHIDFYPCDDNMGTYWLKPYNYKVYRLTTDTLQEEYEFIFPLENSLPVNFTTDSIFNGKRIKYAYENTDVVYRLSNFYKAGDLISFKAHTKNSNSYLFNYKANQLICINKIISDSTSYFLPIVDAEVGGVDFSNHGIINFDGINFYTSYSSLILFNQMEATKNKKPQYPPALKEYFSNPKNKKGNPVLVQIQFKPNL